MSRTITVSLPVADLKASKNKVAFENGGVANINPVQDHGFMYGRDFANQEGSS